VDQGSFCEKIPRSTEFLLDQSSSQYNHFCKFSGNYHLKEDPECRFLYSKHKTTPKRHRKEHRGDYSVKKFNPNQQDGQYYFCGFFSNLHEPKFHHYR
jgi:hypothetical protein